MPQGSGSHRSFLCERCRHVYRVTSEELPAAAHEDAMHTFERWHRVGHWFKPYHHVLDANCQSGAFLERVAPHIRLGVGLQVSPERMTALQSLFTVRTTHVGLRQYVTDDRYDIIFNWHGLQQEPDLQGFVERAAELLVPSGLLLLEVPTHSDWSARATAPDVPPNDRHLFSPESLASIVESRFEVAEIWDGVARGATMLAGLRR